MKTDIQRSDEIKRYKGQQEIQKNHKKQRKRQIYRDNMEERGKDEEEDRYTEK